MEISSLEELHGVLRTDRFDFDEYQVISSKVPADCGSEECVLGVDEAGRGPVLGPMVYAVCYVPKKRVSDLEEIGCADSKTLTEKKREELFSILCACEDYVGWTMDVISPNFISNKMLKRVKYSLNEIAQEATVRLIESVIKKNVNVTEIYVDTVGPPEKYQERLTKLLPGRRVTVAKKADSIYPIVSAASICAKVARDATLRNWRFSEEVTSSSADGNDAILGSGYPNDPQTKSYLRDSADVVFGYPRVVRFSWSTAERMLEESSATVEWDDDEEEEDAEEDAATNKRERRMRTRRITNFFFKSPTEDEEDEEEEEEGSKSKQEMKHSFFRRRNLATATRF